ncbi:potassium:proton antiporter [Ramlibacter henchirensis]|uniref:Potassium:proton antiporter n=1 Tax=Ramlibacter henchirensis TaxID=204072 RepID=A0A4Z0C409_9BURK|nr:monovalent cation/H(+) antiporter subunit G [Ramlibacter henchirensis]TFZ05692.1 potassium:proton antiporter [Ramlibacter henchirensis]
MSTLAGILVLAGALLALAGSIGLLTLPTFYERVHPPTMAATLGTGLVLAACAIHFSGMEGRLILHHLLIGVFMAVTTPVTYLMLVRAALYRDAAEGRDLLASGRQGPASGASPQARD